MKKLNFKIDFSGLKNQIKTNHFPSLKHRENRIKEHTNDPPFEQLRFCKTELMKIKKV